MFAPSMYRKPPLAWTISAILQMSYSKTPSVLGLVTIRAATSSVIWRARSSRSIVPPSLDLTSLTGIAAEVGARGVRAVGRIGDEDVFARVAPLFEAGPDEHHAGQLALGAGRRLEGEGVHARDLAQVVLDELDALRGLPWTVSGGRERVGVGESGQGGHLLVDLGVVLHRAGAEGIEADVDAVVLLGEAGEVADDFDFGDLGKAGDLGPDRKAGQGVLGLGHVELGKGVRPACPCR